MNIKLKEIDKDTLKVGDVVGVARKVEHGRISTFRHRMIISAKIIKITPKRTKIVSDKFGEHDKYEKFYELNEDAAQETILAEAFKILQDGIYKLVELRRNGRLEAMSDEDILEASKHMKAIMEITEKYRKE
ncbi:hypothetical protein [Dorea sp. Marseille-P4042]|uniref:hypothetical protein n=1 Tax=Dorea sp. Marseille-P4042 TaxID=2080749 RepID=UPI000CF896CF|nr:hypothetical protein [Dorea sp. Marseille-P4042]